MTTTESHIEKANEIWEMESTEWERKERDKRLKSQEAGEKQLHTIRVPFGVILQRIQLWQISPPDIFVLPN